MRLSKAVIRFLKDKHFDQKRYRLFDVPICAGNWDPDKGNQDAGAGLFINKTVGTRAANQALLSSGVSSSRPFWTGLRDTA